jgi:hypothetical protein
MHLSAFVAATLVFFVTVGAQAQTVAPATQPPSPAPRRAPPAPPPLGHMPIIDFVVTFTQPAYYSNSSQLPSYDPVDLGGTVRIPVTRRLNLIFDRITEGVLNQPSEASFIGPSPGTVRILPKNTRDVVLQYHATYAFNNQLTMDIGDSFRHRVFSSGTGNGFAFNTNISAQPFPYTLSSTEQHFAYLAFTYVTKPWKALLNSRFAVNETGNGQNVDHHVAVLCIPANVALGATGCAGKTPAQVGYLDEHPGLSKYYLATHGISWLVPVDPRRGTTFLLSERWGYLNFSENIGAPYRWNSALTYQLSKHFSPGFTLALSHADYHSSSKQNMPFTAPNSIHIGSWDIAGAFHVDTNSWFR